MQGLFISLQLKLFLIIGIPQIVIYLSISSKSGKSCLLVKGLYRLLFFSPIKLSRF